MRAVEAPGFCHGECHVITVCDQAAETCPIFPGRAERIHWSFPDPAAVTGNVIERLNAFCQVRDAIEIQLKTWLLTNPWLNAADS